LSKFSSQNIIVKKTNIKLIFELWFILASNVLFN